LQEQDGRVVKWDEARLLVLNSESRSLRAVDDLVVAGEPSAVAADGYAGFAGISTHVPQAALRSGNAIPFRMSLTLAGSSRLSFLPLARKAEIAIKSSWQHPKFEGAPAPLDPTSGASGFAAHWSVLEINRDFGQTWLDGQMRANFPADSALAQSSVGVTFYEPVDIYQRNYRAVHYAVLLIAITLPRSLGAPERRRHSSHAIPDGWRARCSICAAGLVEHLSFDAAYGISAGALVALITVYLSGVAAPGAGLGCGGGPGDLYTMLYWILRSEDYSLLMGSLLLFGVLAILMIATRRVDWTNIARLPRTTGS
jgi:inner membrane protein